VRREKVILVGHLGATEKDGQYCKSRNVKQSERFFHDLLTRLGTDYVDVVMLHNFNVMNDYEQATKPGGQADLARRLQQEGKARALGISVHRVDVAARAVEEGLVDVLMLPAEVSPVRCLSYTLAQVGVSLALPGVKDRAELREALHTLEATAAEQDFGMLVAAFERYVEGECVYCNHCLPCPVHIDVGQVHRLVDLAQLGQDVQAAYDVLAERASACTGCGACMERCPFGVDVIAGMERAAALFE